MTTAAENDAWTAMTRSSGARRGRRRATTSSASAPTSRSCPARSTASRWSISTTAPRRRSRAPCSTRWTTPTRIEYANVHRGLHYLSNTATQQLRGRARDRAPLPQRAGSADEIIFTRNATEAINLVAQLVRRHGHRRGRRDRALDHGAPLQHRALAFPARAQGRRAEVGADHRRRRVPARRVRAAARRRARKIVAITHMSNVLGTVVPIKEVIRLAHARGIPVLVDGSQAAVHMPRRRAAISTATSTSSPATRSTGRPASACSTPRSAHLDAMPPYLGGGEMIESVAVDRITYGKPPHKFEAGTPPIVRGDRARRRAQLHDAGRPRAHRRATRRELRAYAHARLARAATG